VKKRETKGGGGPPLKKKLEKNGLCVLHKKGETVRDVGVHVDRHLAEQARKESRGSVLLMEKETREGVQKRGTGHARATILKNAWSV